MSDSGKRGRKKEGRGRGEREKRGKEEERREKRVERNERVREGGGEMEKRGCSHCKGITHLSLSYPTCSLQRIPQFPQGGRTMQVFCKCDEFMAALMEVCIGLIPRFPFVSCG